MNSKLGSGLRVRGEIKVDTKDGERKVQLLFGDITKLPLEEKMDVIMVSAFSGDYMPEIGTVIGALHRELGLDVKLLAEDKEADMRRHFNCWLSKPLSEHLPYRKLLCFETPDHRKYSHPADLIGESFRCLVPIFKDEAKTVITPLLTDGDQNKGFPQTGIISALLDGAINWMRAGLPLKVLRIVVYRPNHKDGQAIINFFESYKKSLEAAQQKPKDTDIRYDLYLSYSGNDEERVTKVVELLEKEKSDLKIFREHQHLDEEKAWQDDIYNTMAQCKSVVTFLSPNYLSSRACVEQFNIALVCNRGQTRSLLKPVLLETVDEMPTYMELVQYVDCRVDDNMKMLEALKGFLALFLLDAEEHPIKSFPQRYSVFISYSHRNETKAAMFQEKLQEQDSKMKIFFDSMELKAGSEWQQSLYDAIDSSDVLLCLITKEYLESVICHEEYDIALCRHLGRGRDLLLLPILIDDVDDLPYAMSQVPVIDGRQNFSEVVTTVCEAVVEYVQGKQKGQDLTELNLEHSTVDVSEVTAQHRRTWFLQNFTSNKGILEHKDHKHTKENRVQDIRCDESNHPTTHMNDVAFIYAGDQREAFFLNEIMKNFDSAVTTNFAPRTDFTQLASVEQSRLVVALLSLNLVRSEQCMAEINIALAKHRKQHGRPVLYPIQLTGLDKFPTYLHTLPCRIAIQDIVWRNAMKKNRLQRVYVESMSWEAEEARSRTLEAVGQDLAPHEMLALSAAALDIIAVLHSVTPPEDPKAKSRNVTICNIVEMSSLRIAADTVPIAQVLIDASSLKHRLKLEDKKRDDSVQKCLVPKLEEADATTVDPSSDKMLQPRKRTRGDLNQSSKQGYENCMRRSVEFQNNASHIGQTPTVRICKICAALVVMSLILTGVYQWTFRILGHFL